MKSIAKGGEGTEKGMKVYSIKDMKSSIIFFKRSFVCFITLVITSC